MRSRRLPVSPVHLVLGMLLVTLLGACDSGAGTRSAAVVPPAPKADVHTYDWRSASYNVSCPGLGAPANQQVAVTLAGGKGQSTAVPWFGPSVPIDVALVDVTYGDLTGAGQDDAVVHLTCNPHGSDGVADEVQVFGPGAELLARPVLRNPSGSDFAPAIRTLRVAGGQLTGTASYWGPTDPHCCPSQTGPFAFRWNASTRTFDQTA